MRNQDNHHRKGKTVNLLCFECEKPMQKATVTYRGIAFEAWKCPNCKESIFTEEQSLIFARRLDQQRMEENYTKSPMKIGSSWGITFPKDVVDVFRLNNKKTKMKLIPDVAAGKIIIEIKE